MSWTQRDSGTIAWPGDGWPKLEEDPVYIE